MSIDGFRGMRRGWSGDQNDLTIEEAQVERQVGPESLDCALALLARWACRRGQNLGKCPQAQGQNLVTAADIKGYGAQNAED